MALLRQSFVLALSCGAIAVVSATGGCGSQNEDNGGSTYSSSGGSSSGSSGSSSGGDGSPTSSGGSSSGILLADSTTPPGACAGGAGGWKCKVDASCGTSPTTLTGKVYDPAGANPLYNVVVFIPNDPTTLPPITPGTHSCNTCDVSIGDYVVAGLTDETGSFVLKGVPNGIQVPVTVQVGKWRRTTYIDINSDCGDNAVGAGVLHLPGKRADGDMPQMALLTGGCDDLGCFLTGMGIDPGEFGPPPPAAMLNGATAHSGGSIDVYQGLAYGGGNAATLSGGTPGACTTSSCPLWASRQSFEYYDLALFSCECAEQTSTNETPAAYQNLHDWLDEGGKVFASHYHYTWFEKSPDADFRDVAKWGQTGATDTAVGGGTPYDIDTSFPKGVSFGKWLGDVGALGSAGPPPSLTLYTVADSVDAVNAVAPQSTLRWIYDSAGDASSGNHPKYISFGTPIGGISGATPADAGPIDSGSTESGVAEAGAPEGGSADGGETAPVYCGKAVFTDLHTSGSATSGPFSQVSDVPAGCGANAGKLTPQQKALEFLFFDLSACVTNDMAQPPPPPPPPQ
jgi:hypothetical protein